MLHQDSKKFLKQNQEIFDKFDEILNLFFEASFLNWFLIQIPNTINVTPEQNFINRVNNYLTLCGEFRSLTIVTQNKQIS